MILNILSIVFLLIGSKFYLTDGSFLLLQTDVFQGYLPKYHISSEIEMATEDVGVSKRIWPGGNWS